MQTHEEPTSELARGPRAQGGNATLVPPRPPVVASAAETFRGDRGGSVLPRHTLAPRGQEGGSLLI